MKETINIEANPVISPTASIPMSQEGSVIGVITENRQRIKQTQNFKSFIKNLNDIIHLPLTYLGGHSFRRMRANNFKRYPRNKKLLYRLGVFPIIDHYYDPLFNPKQIKHSLRKDRFLPSINLNIKEQLELLSRFNYNKELINIPEEKTAPNKYYYNNYSFLSGDGEYLYNIVRTFKPKKIIEIGSGYSTLMACKAIEKNEKEAKNYQCKVICVEPFEHPWLEELDVEVNRSLVEDLPLSFFESLEANDILFIDSSHMIKPQGDVLFLFLHVLPILKPGVIVHIHDIFTPKDYLDDWILEKNRFWNEQYLLEAFLSFNDQYQIIGALNFLRHFYYNELCMACPVMKSQIERGIDREPGSFWMRRV